MRELSVPRVIEPDPAANLTDAVFAGATGRPDDIVLSRRTGNGWEPVTAKVFADEVSGVAAGLVASGVQPGDRVALMSKTRYEWTVVDYAIWTAGAVTVPIYETSSAEQVEWILSDSGARVAVVESVKHQGVVESVRGQLPALSSVVGIDAGDVDRLVQAGRDVPESDLAARRAGVRGDTNATIIYTSGTTGRPKGCELTHANMLGTALSTSAVLPELFNTAGSTLLFLPLAHVFGRLIQVACVTNGVRMGHTADIKNLLADLKTFQPTFILSVPRVFEKVYNTAKQQAHAGGKGAVFDRAERTAVAYSEAIGRGTVSPVLKLQHALFDRLVYTRLRAAMGGKVAYAVSGGAPLGARLGHFFRGVGVTILEGYGLTETTAAGTVNTVSRIKMGTVGRPGPGVTVRIADDGEILMSGEHIFRGYWRNDTASAEVFDGAPRFFRTGDIGELDADGFLRITGRKKELLVTAGGKNVAPAVLEDRLRAHPLVSQCMVVGDNRPFIACLVTIDAEALEPWKASHGKAAGASVSDLVDDADLRADIQRGVDDANKAVSQAEAIRKFTILAEDFSEEGGTMTPSMKVKRNVVMAQYGAAVDALYN